MNLLLWTDVMSGMTSLKNSAGSRFATPNPHSDRPDRPPGPMNQDGATPNLPRRLSSIALPRILDRGVVSLPDSIPTLHFAISKIPLLGLSQETQHCSLGRTSTTP